MRWKMNKSMKWSRFKVSVKVEQINEYLFWDTVESNQHATGMTNELLYKWIDKRQIKRWVLIKTARARSRAQHWAAIDITQIYNVTRNAAATAEEPKNYG